MVTIVRDRVRDMVDEGMSLEQMQRAKPTADYDGLYGGQSDWTGEMFVDAIYRDLSGTAMSGGVTASRGHGGGPGRARDRRQRRRRRSRVAARVRGAAANARDRRLLDLTGQWVSVITEDWRWRMVTPPKGDTASVPLNPAGRKVADAWDLDADRARGDLCKAFGPPGLIRQPGRLRIRWENDNTLLLEFDAGMQTRRLQFGARGAGRARSLQGQSVARGFGSRRTAASSDAVAPPRGGSLEVVTTNLHAGYLRPNGVPVQRARRRQGVLRQFHAAGTAARG